MHVGCMSPGQRHKQLLYIVQSVAACSGSYRFRGIFCLHSLTIKEELDGVLLDGLLLAVSLEDLLVAYMHSSVGLDADETAPCEDTRAG